MNLFQNIPAELPEELSETLLEAKYVRIERIVSKGHCSPEGSWYDQDEDEWVVLLKGRAQLVIEGVLAIEMEPGDTYNIPAHQRHRVEWTDGDSETIWLAIFYE